VTSLTKNQKRILFIWACLFFLIISVFFLNHSFYMPYQKEIMIQMSNMEQDIIVGKDRRYIENHMQKQLMESGFKDVIVSISGGVLYGDEVSISIEGTPPVSKLDKLLKRKIEPIRIENKVFNTKTIG
jgi:hypothetical protein